MYLLRVPFILKKIMPKGLWEMPADREDRVYLTFDDGPHPQVTPFVLEQLKEYKAKATFFCVGNNVKYYPEIYRQIIREGHTVGNHTFHHLKGSRSKSKIYLEDIKRAAELIDSPLFRPPYGRIKHRQANLLAAAHYQLVYWSLLSGDFDTELSPRQCLENVVLNIKPGDIVVFHDSQKAWDRLHYVLPRVLRHCREKNFNIRALSIPE